MPFDPDKYLADKGVSVSDDTGFDPDSYISTKTDKIETETQEGTWDAVSGYAEQFGSDVSTSANQGIDMSLDNIALAASLGLEIDQKDRIEALDKQVGKLGQMKQLYPQGLGAVLDKDFWVQTIANQAIPLASGTAAGLATGPAGAYVGPHRS